MIIHHAEAMRMKAGPSEGAIAAPWGPPDRLRTVGPVGLVVHGLPHEIHPETHPVDADVRPHPHIGLIAVSYLLDGYITHRDSLGARFEIEPGGVCFTISGRGVVHSERLERLRILGGRLEMFQILLALPDGSEDVEPSSRYIAPGDLPTETAPGSVVKRVIGDPVDPLMPAFVHDVQLESERRYRLPSHPERAFYVMTGQVEVSGRRFGAGQTVVLEPGQLEVRAIAAARLLAFGGHPVGPRYLWWNYLHSSLDAIEAAKAEWRAGRVKLPPGDTESFTPAPPDGGRPLRRLNAAA